MWGGQEEEGWGGVCERNRDGVGEELSLLLCKLTHTSCSLYKHHPSSRDPPTFAVTLFPFLCVKNLSQHGFRGKGAGQGMEGQNVG